MRRTLAAALFLCAALHPGISNADTTVYRSEYAITVLGLPVGTSSFETEIGSDHFKMTGTMTARGLLALFQPTSGSVTVTGNIVADRIAAREFTLNYTSGDEKQRTEIGFANGGVASTVNEPKVKKRKDWIEVTAAQLKGASDPISALLIRANAPGDVCNRTVRIFDGAMRLDVKLAFLRIVPWSIGGRTGDAVMCRATFEPVSGYHKSRKEIAWLREKGRMDVAFATIEGTGVYAPLRATASTQIGPVRVYATRFEILAK
ncbi:DUF3108 domain-containing protein [Oricola sp.]|uniref:DUF3108 domain-containing protein n=1 Tax=Oricola sp. TaxID=1979950 RepID=UPI003515C4C7